MSWSDMLRILSGYVIEIRLKRILRFKRLNRYKMKKYYHEHTEIILYLKTEISVLAVVYVMNVTQSGSYYDYSHKET